MNAMSPASGALPAESNAAATGRKHVDEALVATGEFAQVPAHRDQVGAGSFGEDRALHHDQLTGGLQLFQARADGGLFLCVG